MPRRHTLGRKQSREREAAKRVVAARKRRRNKAMRMLKAEAQAK